jgi:hypothetical protein
MTFFLGHREWKGARTLAVRCGTRGRDSDRHRHFLFRPLLLLDDKGEKKGLKLQYLPCLSVLHRSDQCLLADESSLVINLELYLSGLENICVSTIVCLNLIVIIKRLYC